ncbi:MAG: LPXTG cell wall anchor domain-containing protein [Actinomycetota bacterium]|nr:LPXTG cell wall anchor domain-containing protein [Actinomycetota bacterium]
MAKTVVLAAALAAGLLVLAGPAEAQGEPPGAEVSATGVLTEAPPTAPPGTYFMIDGSGTAYQLRSDVVDLGAYVGQLVTVFGAPAPVQGDPGPVPLNVTRVEPIEGTGPFTVTFELSVEGVPPADATFFGLLGYEPIPFRLTDPDSDGVYTASTPPGLVPGVDTQPAQIVQGAGTRPSILGPDFPGEPVSVIRDFGPVVINRDTTLPASVSFVDGSDNPPSTGNSSLVLPVLGVAGALLVAGGLLVRKILRCL